MKKKNGAFSILLVIVCVLSLTQRSFACPDIDGLVNFNCDKIIKIAFVGDSIVSGAGDTLKKGGYVVRLRNRLVARVTNGGVPGITSGRFIRHLKTQKKLKRKSKYFRRAFGADIIIIDVGRNDYWDEYDPAITARNIRRAFKILTRKRWRKNKAAPYVVVANLLPTTRGFQAPFVNAVNSKLDFLSTGDLPLELDFNSMPTNLLAGDGLHPTSEGYYWLTNLIEAYIKGPLQTTLRSRRLDEDSDEVFDVFEERLFHTDPGDPDTDHDAITDGEELFQLQTDPLDPSDPQTEADPETEDDGDSDDGEEGNEGEGEDGGVGSGSDS